MIKRPDTIGARMRYWRMRRGGMTQAVLAGLAGVTQSYVSQVESGRKTIDRRSTLVALAAALQVTVADLLGQGTESGDPARESAAECVPAIWSALIEIEDGERRPSTYTTERLAAEIVRADQLRNSCNYPAMARMLPSLLLEAAAVGGAALAQVAYLASTCLRHLGYRHGPQCRPGIRIGCRGRRRSSVDRCIPLRLRPEPADRVGPLGGQFR